ncbi:hypothetical protein P8452_12996 [Trifolium repens]|nr:hypothetical protein P8452_12996 [Trifolium repens]
MKKTNQTKKTKDLESMPNFSLGLTPSEEEGEMKDKKAEEYLDHYRGCIQIYNGAVQTLERRIAEDVGTSAKQHAIAQKQKGEDDESENDDSEDGGNVNGESEDTESDDAAGNSDVKRVNSGANEHENDDESDDDEVAKTISKESKEAGSKEAQAATESRAGAETEVGESSNAQRFNNDQNEINAELLDESVKAACNVGLTLTQETIIKFPQFFDGGEAKDADLNKTESVSQGSDSVTAETILKYPEFFDAGEASTKKECSQSLALVLYEAPPTVKHEDKSDSDVCIDATPLRSVLPDEPRRRARVRSESEVYSDADADFSDNGLSPGIKQIFQQEWDNFKQSHAGDGKFMHECRRKSNHVGEGLRWTRIRSEKDHVREGSR